MFLEVQPQARRIQRSIVRHPKLVFVCGGAIQYG
jgi:hypothetical protein